MKSNDVLEHVKSKAVWTQCTHHQFSVFNCHDLIDLICDCHEIDIKELCRICNLNYTRFVQNTNLDRLTWRSIKKISEALGLKLYLKVQSPIVHYSITLKNNAVTHNGKEEYEDKET